MQLDDMKRVWASHGADLERSLAINERLLRELLLGKMRSAFVPFQIASIFGVAIGITTIATSMRVLADHCADPLYVVFAGGLAVLAGYVSGLCAYLVHQTTTIDYTAPVTMLKRSIEQVRLAEYRTCKWTLLCGIVAWLPMALIFVEALTGVDALARVGLAWLIANVLFGFACLGIGQLLSLRYLERTELAPWARRLLDTLSGRGVRLAIHHLMELERFERTE